MPQGRTRLQHLPTSSGAPFVWLSSQDWFHLGATASNATPRFELTDIESLCSSQQTCALRPVSSSTPVQGSRYAAHGQSRRYRPPKARRFLPVRSLSTLRNGHPDSPIRPPSGPTAHRDSQIPKALPPK